MTFAERNCGNDKFKSRRTIWSTIELLHLVAANRARPCGWSDGCSVDDRIPRQSNQHNTEKQEKERLVTEIRNALPDDGVFVSDTSFTGAFTPCYYEVRKTGRTYRQHRGMAGIGDVLPATIGAKCAAVDKIVVGMGGDGGFSYHVSELETAKRAWPEIGLCYL